MRLLVLGGSSFVGAAAVAEALDRGWEVTTFNRGRTAPATDPRVAHITGDRTDPATLAPLRRAEWDVVVDTWSGAPAAARDSARALAGRAGHYAYVSSCSVYGAPPPTGADEGSVTVAADPDASATEYPADKRGAELAVAREFGGRATFLRAGLILGPREDVGRLTWWLARIARGGEVLAPGPADTPIQSVDARDLAAFALDGARSGLAGAYNVTAAPGAQTIGGLLEACVTAAAPAAGATLTWVRPSTILAAGIEPWNELPIWIPPGHDYRGLHEIDSARAHADGLRCRPLADTVADTWRWMGGLGGPPPRRPDLPAPGLDADRERAVLAAAR